MSISDHKDIWDHKDISDRKGILDHEGIRRARRMIGFAVVLFPAFYFFPIVTTIFVVCGALDVGRHRKITFDLIEKYFMAAGSRPGSYRLSIS